jgi:histidyl-tRNA synthetase
MAHIQPLRGTRDLLPAECRKFRHVESVARRIAGLYGFGEIETPIMESSAVFKRTLGDTSDIVTKQMYCFLDRGGDEMVLRPEGTAGIARAFISEGLSQHIPLKLFYFGPMFRYERPQKGRYRQFYQAGVELLGADKPQADVEVIAMGWQILRSLNLKGDIALHLNTIGDGESRAAYRDRLVAYLRTRAGELSPESLERLEKNPLRILDSKDEGDKRVVAEAPSLEGSLNDSSRKFIDEIQEGLTRLGLSYVIDPLLVRGLDYYCHTVFEFTTNALGSQNAVLAGGRYDNLISDMGGPKTPGVGFAAGVDRLTLMLEELPNEVRPVAIVPLGEEAEKQALLLAQELRLKGLSVELGYSGNMAKRLKRAAGLNSRFAVIFGSDELGKGVVQLKDLDKGEQIEVSRTELHARLQS